MPIYIVRPKDKRLQRDPAAFANLPGRMQPEERVKAIAEVARYRESDPIRRQIRSEILKSPQVTEIPVTIAGSAITGTSVVEMPEEEAERLRRDMPEVAIIRDRPLDLIEPTLKVPRSDRFSSRNLWHLKRIGLTPAMRKRKGQEGKGVTIAVLDTGVDETHPEFGNGAFAGGYQFDTQTGRAQLMSPSRDTHGHGTHVTGLICGKNVGVAPGSKVISGLMLPAGHGQLSNFIFALEWASSRPEVQIVNISAGLTGYLPEMHQILADAVSVGILPIVATGNEGRNKTRSPGNYVEVLSIGAIDRHDKVCSFSSSGTLLADSHLYTVPDLVAPGKDIYSCVVGGGYESWDGTSMATPIVSGIAALYLERYPNIGVVDLVEAIFEDCEYLGAEEQVRQGHGLINIGRLREPQSSPHA